MEIFIPQELKPHEADIRRFIDAMIFKLRKNCHKGFGTVGVPEALARIIEETDELRRATEEGNAIEIVLEAADVANFALFAAHAAIGGPVTKPTEMGASRGL